jgi:hypothetical protein
MPAKVRGRYKCLHSGENIIVSWGLDKFGDGSIF